MAAAGGSAVLVQDFIDYYAAKGYYRHIIRVCQDAINQNGGTEQTAFWKAFAISMEGNLSDAIREFEPLKGRPSIALAVTAALITTHSLSQHKDKDAINQLKNQLKDDSQTDNEADLAFAGRYFLHSDKEKQARKCVDKALTKSRKDREALIVCGWLYLNSGNDKQEKKAITFFEAALALSDHKDVGAWLGRAACFEKARQYSRAMEDYNQIIVHFPTFTPAYIEKARLLLLMDCWEDAIDEATRVLRRDPNTPDAIKVMIVYMLAREHKPTAAIGRIQEYQKILEKVEPANSRLLFETAQLVSRLACRHTSVLKAAQALLDQASRISPQNSLYLTEQANVQLMVGDYDSATRLFSDAAQLDETNIKALLGRIKCQILQKNYVQAQQELEFMSEVAEVSGKSADLLYLQAMLAWRRDRDEMKSITLLNEAVQGYQAQQGAAPAGFGLYTVYNPDLMMEVVEEYMQHISTEPPTEGNDSSPLLKNVLDLLERLTALIPGMLSAQQQLVRCHYIDGKFDKAERVLLTCFRLDAQSAETYLLQAQVSLAKGSFQQASQALEQALSLNFGIRNQPIYHFIKARIYSKNKNLAEALKMLEAAMNLPGVKRANPKYPISAHDRIQIFLELASVHAQLNHLPEAAKIMQDARLEFENSSDIHRVAIADAELSERRRDVEGALTILRSIPSDSVHFTKAKMKMADIYLVHRNNRKLFANCYLELATEGNSVHQYVLLGEAYMRIQEPEKAIEAFETALKMDPSDPTLASRIGHALITTHDYAKAVRYYEAAAQSDPSKTQLFHDLAELYLRLRKYDEAVRVLQSAVKTKGGVELHPDDPKPLVDDVTTYLLMAQVFEANKNYAQMEQTLKEAYNMQTTVLGLLRDRDQDALAEQRKQAAAICYNIGNYFQNNAHDQSQARQFFNEALKHESEHTPSLLALAKLHLANEELEECQQHCKTLRVADPDNLDVSMMMADIMFRKGDYDAATHYFQQLLTKNATHFKALAQLIKLLRRAGRLNDAQTFLEAAEKSSARAAFDAGFRFCKGLYSRYTNDSREALKQLNFARKDGDWGRDALTHMVEIYLNPDLGALFQESTEAKGDHSEQLVAAENLLKELFVQSETPEAKRRYKVLESYALMASSQKPHMEQAMQNLMGMLKDDQDYVPALLAIANAFLLTKQVPKARNQLKRITKMNLDPQFEEDFERAYLMLSDLYIGSGKYDLATELCKKVLKLNKSSAKAWEHLGLIMEKEEAYRDAAQNYEYAWRNMNESSPSIGFKLAFNYLKAKRYVEAITVCHKVLKAHPQYPKMRKEILEKARLSLRP